MPQDINVNSLIKVKNEDGTFTNIYPVTKASNVELSDGGDLEAKFGDTAPKVHDHKFDSTVPNTVTVGGLVKGETYDNIPLEDMIFKLLHPYVNPEISYSCSPNGGTYEKGITVATANVSATGKRTSDKLQRMRIFKDNAVVKTLDNELNSGNISISESFTDLVSNTTFKADVYDGKNTISSSTTTFTFLYPMYIGTVADSIPTEESIKAMTKKVTGRGNQSQSFTFSNQRMCIATPPGWEVKTVIDPNGFDVTASFTKSTVSVTGLDGTPQTYNILTSGLTSQSNFVVKFNV